MNRQAQLAVVHQVFDNELHIWWEWADDDGGTLVRWSGEDKAINSHLVEAADDLPVLWRWLDEVAMTFQPQTATQMGRPTPRRSTPVPRRRSSTRQTCCPTLGRGMATRR